MSDEMQERLLEILTKIDELRVELGAEEMVLQLIPIQKEHDGDRSEYIVDWWYKGEEDSRTARYRPNTRLC